MFCFLAPLILAAQHTRLLIVYQLLLRGERIEKPHGYTCLCKSCRKSSASDSFRHAQIFKLGSELRDLARVEHYFGKEYNKLANQLSIFVARLLDNIRGHRELEIVLNKTGRAHEEKYEPLSRFELSTETKRTMVQRSVDYSKYISNQTFLLLFGYPFLPLAFYIDPKSKMGSLVIMTEFNSKKYPSTFCFAV